MVVLTGGKDDFDALLPRVARPRQRQAALVDGARRQHRLHRVAEGGTVARRGRKPPPWLLISIFRLVDIVVIVVAINLRGCGGGGGGQHRHIHRRRPVSVGGVGAGRLGEGEHRSRVDAGDGALEGDGVTGAAATVKLDEAKVKGSWRH